MTIAHVVLGIIGIGFLIFIHELGHFIAAKWAGVRVERFSIGLAPRIIGFRLAFFARQWGETEYVIGMIPFAGYVKMVGETTEEHQGKADEFMQQPVHRRAVILAAGATVNMVFGLAAFIAAFAIGVSFQAPEVGSVIPGSAAWDAGVLPGDTVLAIDGTAVESMPDVGLAAVLGGCVERTLTVERGTTRHDIKVTPRNDPTLGMPTLGLVPSTARTIGAVRAGSPAAKAGISPDEEVLAATLQTKDCTARLDSASLPRELFVRALSQTAQAHAGATVVLRVKSPQGAERDVPLTIEAAEELKAPRVGIKLARYAVQFVRPGSEAATFFRPGDVVATLNGARTRLVTPSDILRTCTGREPIDVRTDDGRETSVARDTLLAWIWREDVLFGDAATRVLSTRADSRAARAELQPGDRIVRVGETWVGDQETVERALQRAGEAQARLGVVRGGRVLDIDLPAVGPLGITWDERPEAGDVEPLSPAAVAGVLPGDIMLRIDDEATTTWEAFTTTIRARGDRDLRLTLLRDGNEIALSMRPVATAMGALGITFNPEHVLIREPNMGKAVALGAKRTVISIEQIFVTLLRLVKGEVATRNLQGPLGIIHVTALVARYGLGTLLYFLALISVNLGVLNLLPIPILDGGHLTLLACEKIRGARPNERLVAGVTWVVFFLLISLALYVTFYDVIRMIG